MLDTEYYELILMDVQMPEMDGLEATRYIREHHKIQPVIVAMTANAMKEDRDECLKIRHERLYTQTGKAGSTYCHVERNKTCW